MADDTPTVAAARRAYTQARTEWYELPVRDDNAEDVLAFHVAMDEALDTLIAAVRAEYRPEPCADHPTAEKVTVCEACIEEQIYPLRPS